MLAAGGDATIGEAERGVGERMMGEALGEYMGLFGVTRGSSSSCSAVCCFFFLVVCIKLVSVVRKIG